MKSRTQIVGPALKHTFWDTYDHLGILILVNFLAVLLSLPVLTLPLALAGVFHVACRIASEQEARLGDFFAGMAELWRRFYLLAGLTAIVCVFGVLNIWFYLSVRKELMFLGMVAAGVCFWFAVLFLVGQLYVGPLLCRPEVSFGSAFKLGYWLLMRNIGATIVVCFYLLFVVGLLVISGVGVVLLGLVLPAIFAHNLALHAGRASGVSDFERTEEKRTFRDLLRPWDNK